jgi:hypothetical protein
MTDHTYTLNIPNSANNPSFDQPNMEVNNNSAAAIWLDDHYGFGDDNGGLHQQSTYPNTVTPGSSTNLSSVAYTTAGMASPTTPQYVYQNSQGTFPLSGVRAFGVFTVTAANAVTLSNGYNVSSATAAAVLGLTIMKVTVNLKANTINASGDDQAALLTGVTQRALSSTGTISSTGVAVITVQTSGTSISYPFSLSFEVLQA